MKFMKILSHHRACNMKLTHSFLNIVHFLFTTVFRNIIATTNEFTKIDQKKIMLNTTQYSKHFVSYLQ